MVVAMSLLASLPSACIYEDNCTDIATRVDGKCQLVGDSGPRDSGPDAGTLDAGDGGPAGRDSGTDGGSAVDAGADACPTGLMECSTGCRDLSSDRDHCGECGTRCVWGCVDGSCETVDRIEAAVFHTCALMDSGRVYCWGDNRNGQLGDGSAEELRPEPGLVSSDVGAVVDLTTTGAHACTENDAGRVHCWGLNTHGQLGRASPSASSTPLPVEAVTASFGLTAGFSFTCFVVGSEAKCWGNNEESQLGDGTTDPSTAPVTVLDPGSTGSLALDFVSAGDHHACGIGFRPGQLYCWGNNSDGLLGSGDGIETDERVEVSGMTDIVQVETGLSHNCARRLEGEALCWGSNEFGQIGDGTDASTGVDARHSPVPVTSLTNAIDIAAGSGHTCAIRDGGQVLCWGKNDLGQLGNGTTTPSNVPVEVPGLDDAVQVSVGLGEHACALRRSGELVCWGRNDFGQLGDGTSGIGEYRPTPSPVSLP